MTVIPVPAGYRSVTPYMVAEGAAAAIEWYIKVYGARELMRLSAPEGKVGHAEIEIGDCRIMIADEAPEHDARGPKAFGGSPIAMHLYVADVDTVLARAAAEGGVLTRPATDMFYGDRSGTVRDPFGHIWHVATHIEDVALDEIERRVAAMRPT